MTAEKANLPKKIPSSPKKSTFFHLSNSTCGRGLVRGFRPIGHTMYTLEQCENRSRTFCHPVLFASGNSGVVCSRPADTHAGGEKFSDLMNWLWVAKKLYVLIDALAFFFSHLVYEQPGLPLPDFESNEIRVRRRPSVVEEHSRRRMSLHLRKRAKRDLVNQSGQQERVAKDKGRVDRRNSLRFYLSRGVIFMIWSRLKRCVRSMTSPVFRKL
jgi:hypothetical protein